MGLKEYALTGLNPWSRSYKMTRNFEDDILVVFSSSNINWAADVAEAMLSLIAGFDGVIDGIFTTISWLISFLGQIVFDIYNNVVSFTGNISDLAEMIGNFVMNAFFSLILEITGPFTIFGQCLDFSAGVKFFLFIINCPCLAVDALIPAISFTPATDYDEIPCALLNCIGLGCICKNNNTFPSSITQLTNNVLFECLHISPGLRTA